MKWPADSPSARPRPARSARSPCRAFLGELLATHLSHYPSSDGWVFTAAEGGPVRHRNFYARHYRPAVARAGLPDGLRFHDLRHTCAASLIAEGRHIEEVKDYLGHSSIRVTSDRYGHLFPKARAEMADALDARFRRAAGESPAAHSRPSGVVLAFPSENIGSERRLTCANMWSGRRDSNPRPSPWQGDALPAEPRPREPSRIARLPDSAACECHADAP